MGGYKLAIFRPQFIEFEYKLLTIKNNVGAKFTNSWSFFPEEIAPQLYVCWEPKVGMTLMICSLRVLFISARIPAHQQGVPDNFLLVFDTLKAKQVFSACLARFSVAWLPDPGGCNPKTQR